MAKTKIDLVLERLNRIEQKVDEQGEKIYDMHGEVSGLKARASIFGLLSGVVGTLIASIGLYLKGH